MSTFLFVCNLPAETVLIRVRALCQKVVHGHGFPVRLAPSAYRVI